MPDENSEQTTTAQPNIVLDAGPDYTILQADDASTLSSLVNQLLRRGFEPVGGVAVGGLPHEVIEGEYEVVWTQAMIKRG